MRRSELVQASFGRSFRVRSRVVDEEEDDDGSEDNDSKMEYHLVVFVNHAILARVTLPPLSSTDINFISL